VDQISKIMMLSPGVRAVRDVQEEAVRVAVVKRIKGGISMTDENKEVKISFSTLKGLSYWAGFLGNWLIVVGIFALIGAIFSLSRGYPGLGAFLSGLVSGVISLVMGSRLRKAKASIESYMFSNRSVVLEDGLDNIRVFFKIQGILIIIAIVIFIIAIIAGLSGTFMFMGYRG